MQLYNHRFSPKSTALNNKSPHSVRQANKRSKSVRSGLNICLKSAKHFLRILFRHVINILHITFIKPQHTKSKISVFASVFPFIFCCPADPFFPISQIVLYPALYASLFYHIPAVSELNIVQIYVLSAQSASPHEPLSPILKRIHYDIAVFCRHIDKYCTDVDRLYILKHSFSVQTVPVRTAYLHCICSLPLSESEWTERPSRLPNIF